MGQGGRAYALESAARAARKLVRASRARRNSRPSSTCTPHRACSTATPSCLPPAATGTLDISSKESVRNVLRAADKAIGYISSSDETQTQQSGVEGQTARRHPPPEDAAATSPVEVAPRARLAAADPRSGA